MSTRQIIFIYAVLLDIARTHDLSRHAYQRTFVVVTGEAVRN